MYVGKRISPAVVSPGNTTAWGRRKKASLCHPCRQLSAPACGVPRRRNGSRAQRRQREVRRECRNEDFSGCYFARKYNCMGTPKKKPPFVTRVASRVHPLAGCRGAAAETERSEGKGRFGGILNTVTSRRTGVRGCMEQERKRKRRDKDVDTRCNHSVRFRQCRGDVRFSG